MRQLYQFTHLGIADEVASRVARRTDVQQFHCIPGRRADAIEICLIVVVESVRNVIGLSAAE